MKALLLCSTIFYCATALQLPPDYIICKRSDERMNECLQSAIQYAIGKLGNGLPEFHFPSLIPLKIDAISIGEGTGVVLVTQNYRKVEIYGMANIKIENVEMVITDKEHSLKVDTFLDELVMKAEYDLNGKVLIFPVYGIGNCTIKLSDTKTTFTMLGKTFERKNKQYLHYNVSKFVMNPKKAYYNFENLYNGDEKLGADFNVILNENSMKVFDDVKYGYEEVFSIIFRNLINLVTHKLPYDEMFPL